MHADQAKPEATGLFAAGDYSFWSRILEPASQSLVEAARVGAGGRVLDVAAGDGNTALAASRRGAIVTALDSSRRRSSGGGSGPGWRAVRSHRSVRTVDAYRSPTRASTAASIRSAKRCPSWRCSASCARAASLIDQWTGEGFFGAYVELVRRSSPGPDRGEYRPDLGQEDFVRTSLAPFAENIGVQRRAIRARFATAESFCDELLGKDPYVRPLQAAMASERWEDFSEELCRLVSAWNAADDGSVLLELKYQLTVATKPRT